jgi:DNA-binding PadR family transcriptional regulator
MSGYDIKKVVDVGLSHFWNENYGQIYPTLDQLVKDGLATKKAERKSGKRQRFVYKISRQGKQAFRDWIGEPTDTPIVRNELQLKFFLCSSLSTSTSIRLIESHQSQQRAVLEEYRHSEELLCNALQGGNQVEELNEILAPSRSNSDLRKKQLNTFYLTLRQGILIMEARLAWCEEVLENLKTSTRSSDS